MGSTIREHFLPKQHFSTQRGAGVLISAVLLLPHARRGICCESAGKSSFPGE